MLSLKGGRKERTGREAKEGEKSGGGRKEGWAKTRNGCLFVFILIL